MVWGVEEARCGFGPYPERNVLAVATQGRNRNGIYDVTSGDQVPLTTLAEAYGRGISWSPDGKHVALTSDDKLIISKPDGTQLHETPRYKDAKGLWFWRYPATP